MSEYPINDMMGLSLDKIRELADANTVVGKPITGPDGSVLLPISKLSVGLATGGADFGGHEKSREKNVEQPNASAVTDKKWNFGGGAGAGVNVTPVAFLVMPAGGGEPRVLPVGAPASTSLDRAIDLVPDLLNRIQTFIAKHKVSDDEEKSGADSGLE